jgi:hypothetical protein
MKTIQLFFAVFLTAFVTTGNTFAQTNMVKNGGFETWTNTSAAPDNWEYRISNTASVISLISGTPTTGEVNEGTNAVKISLTGNAARGLNQFIGKAGLSADKEYTLSFWYKYIVAPSEGSGNYGLKVSASYYYYSSTEIFGWKDIVSSGQNEAPYTPLPVVLDTWLPASFTGTTPATGVIDSLYIELLVNRMATVVVDDIQLVCNNCSTKQPQTITGLSDITKTVSDADFDLTATASSNLAVTYSSSNTAVATVTGSKVHIVGAGTSTITASQTGDNNYEAAPDVTATLTVNAAVSYTWLLAPAITIEGTNAKVVGTDADQFTLFFINDLAAPLTDGTVSLEGKTGDLSLKATTADGASIIKLKVNITADIKK